MVAWVRLLPRGAASLAAGGAETLRVLSSRPDLQARLQEGTGCSVVAAGAGAATTAFGDAAAGVATPAPCCRQSFSNNSSTSSRWFFADLYCRSD